MIRVCVLASGSKGNSVYVESPGARVLVDAGLSGKESVLRLRRIGVEPHTLTGLVVTHEHTDHISGVGVLSRMLDLPVYVTEPTYVASLPRIKRVDRVRLFEEGDRFRIEDLTFRSFVSCHDAADPVNFVISRDGVKVGFATDLGYPTHLVRDRLKGCSALILETNHDRKMLQKGPYPEPVKQRILSNFGHLSNEQGAELLASLGHSGLKHVFLAHLSEINNQPEKALRAVTKVLEGQEWKPRVHLCRQDCPGPVVSL